MELTLDQALQKGIEAHKAGQVQEADRYYTAILKANPKHPDANHNMGVLAVGVGKVEVALPFFKTALETNPSIRQFWLSYIDALINLGRMHDARAVLEQAKSNGANGDGLDKLEAKLDSIDFENSNMKETHFNEEEKLLNPSQNQLETLIELYRTGEFLKALKQASKLLLKFPKSVILKNIVGATNQGLGKLDEAIEAYKAAITIKPDYTEAYNNMGNALKEQGKREEAIKSYKKALSIKPNYAEAYNNMGNALNEEGKLEEAIKAFKKALFINPEYADAYYNMGVTLHDQGKPEEAVKAYQNAVIIKPDYAAAYNNMGNTFMQQGKLEETIKACERALSIKADYAQAYFNIGNALKDQGKRNSAVEAYRKAVAIKPDYGSAKHMLNSLSGTTPKTAPREYIEGLFDGYANKFENSLVSNLEYKIPKLITDLLVKTNDQRSLGSILDLGCGTGLFGSEIKKYCSSLEGIDLSNKMLESAKQKNIYNKLTKVDIIEYLKSATLNFDYFIATDVFIYVGALSEVFYLIKSRNKKSGKLVFSTEHSENGNYRLLKTGRYSHSKSYIEKLCKRFGYKLSHFSSANLRKEKEVFITGGIYILETTK